MGGTLSGIQNTVDGVGQDLGATMITLANTISDFRHDASGTMSNVSNECVESLRRISQRVDQTAYLLTNAVLAMITAIALGILLHLTHFSTFSRTIVWSMYAVLCLHMLLTYIRHSRSRSSSTSQQQQQASIPYQNQQLELLISQSKVPTEIDLSGRRLIDEDMTIVVIQAINNQQCTKLQLIGNQITSTGASILADALLDNRTLEQLSLWRNQVGDRGVQSLSDRLSFNRSTLKKLDLAQNGVTDEGARYLAQMLKTNRTLTHLTLSNNQISDKGIRLLADALQNRNNILQTLSFTENKLLTDSSVDSLINMFKDHQSLKRLWVDDCSLSEKGKDRLRKAAKSKKNFRLDT